MSVNCTLEMVEVINFMLCIFYYNKKNLSAIKTKLFNYLEYFMNTALLSYTYRNNSFLRVLFGNIQIW